MKKLYRLFIEYRGGVVESVFVATDKEVKKIKSNTIFYGEILGKHSDVMVDIEDEDLEVISEDQDFIEKFEKIVGYTGYNPLKYLNE